ncbi:AAA-ATPase At3g28510-like isoform X2 [Diospyros lotus]|uniref:AAA-ATPase At3g28510-like isoform X2 n=1 Tax=Diospyros lotus TaxID=55363 RepID=UPI00224FDA59|nr:AAA-ATPase At3g28510-like isoform X2 [Diospyros lotus]
MVNAMAFIGPQWAQGETNQMAFAMAIGASMVIMTMFQQYLTHHFGGYLQRLMRKLISSMDPYVQIKFPEDSAEGGPKNYEAYSAIETYLSVKCSLQASRLKANSVKDIRTPVLCVDDGDVSDEFNGIRVSWHLNKEKDQGSDRYGHSVKRYFVLTFRKKHRKTVVEEYLKHVMNEGKKVVANNRQLKLYSNSSSDRGARWNYIMDFDHQARFETIAMGMDKKQDIINDLETFKDSKEYYRRIGKPWKRGYLLYGPPGTGKSTMIAAMANLLKYDVYDLELTAVSSNADLKRLLNRTPGDSILVIEDVDCSSKITVQREIKKQNGDEKEKVIERVTLSGLLNCLDGLFSANEGGRLMVFTTNHIENLDSALIRRGRMDRHIEMSFCSFEAFKVFAENYLGIFQNHDLFPRIQGLLEKVNITPADVAEYLIRKSADDDTDTGDLCLDNLIKVLEAQLLAEAAK